MRKLHLLSVSALAAASLLAAVPAAAQQAGSTIVRVRAVNLDPDNKGAAGDAGVSVNRKTIPEVDVAYFFTPEIAAELVLTYPQKHDVRLAGTGTIGTLKHLPPTLLAQYHFPNVGGVTGLRPYVGLGVNYTRFSNVRLPTGLDIDRNSWGPAFQVGVDYELGGGWLVNLDVKKVQIRTDVTGIGTLKVDPLLVGIGVGYRF